MNLKKKIKFLGEEVKRHIGAKDVIIVGYNDAELEEKKRKYSEMHPEPARFICMRIVYAKPMKGIDRE
ncbi:hypothetical protein ACFL0H_00280 [Thermodesulfobacteriota bacterium]